MSQQSPHTQQGNKEDDSWKSDLRIQALTAERMQQLEADEAILVGQEHKQVPLYELTQIQFLMGFIKNANDTMDSLTRQYMLLELFGLLKLTDAALWAVTHKAFM